MALSMQKLRTNATAILQIYKSSIVSSKCFSNSYANIDISLHDENQQKVMKEWADYSIETNKVILHTLPKGLFKYGYATTFTGKVESYLKYNGIDYEIDEQKNGLILAKPMHKIPWITHNGIATSDSQIIIERLNKELLIDNNSHLSKEEKAISIAFNNSMDQLYFIDLYRRYTCNRNCLLYLYSIVGDKDLAEGFQQEFQQMVIDQLWQQGTGRFDGDTVYYKLCNHIDSILDYIQDKKFFFGDEISEIDFSVYSQLSSIYSFTASYPNTIEFDGVLPRQDEVINYILRLDKEFDKRKG